MERTLQEINHDIEVVKNQLDNVSGTPTEVYARIVGYYRSVRNWNKGKKDEYQQRKMFSSEIAKPLKKESKSIVSYEVFVRKTCPNCPPVKDFLLISRLNGKLIDADTEEGLGLAAEKGVLSTPTVIFYDDFGSEIARCHSISEIKEIM